ncbi:MAG: TIGR03915 family putative DNA repair protein [Flavobacteriaceae bacterium]
MKESESVLIYDNSFNGFMSAVYWAFYKNVEIRDIQSIKNSQRALFSENTVIETNITFARRVWFGIQKKNYNALKIVYFAFLSESSGIELKLYNYIKYIYSNKTNSSSYISKEDILKINSLAGLVGREKKRIEAQLRFKNTFADVQVAYIEPGFNVLPLVSRHFKSVYKQFHWIVFDSKRNYGIYFNGQGVRFVSAGFVRNLKAQKELLEAHPPTLIGMGLLTEAENKTTNNKNLDYEKSYTAA